MSFNRIRLLSASLALAAGVSMVSGCANPADDVAPAQVSEPKVTPIPPASEGTEVPPAPDVKKASATLPSASSGTALAITPANSKIEFIGSKVTQSHTGGFKAFTGTYEPAGDKVEAGKLKAEIDMASTYSDDPKLTAHLKAPDFFDVAKFPTATFETTAIKPGASDPKAKDATHTVTGDLTLHGVTKSISFPAKISGGADSLNLDSEFSINRKDFGISYAGQSDNLIRDGVVLKLSIHASKS
jgi:polyisoprenoid-binding protein YceI